MTLQLHVWGPAFGLPSIDAECLATIVYLNRVIPCGDWTLIADYEPSISPRNEFPLLIDGVATATGFANITSYLRNHRSEAYDLDSHLSHEQQTDRTAFVSFLQSTANPLIDLSLYVSSANYNSTTSSAYTAILPWYLNYTLPPTRRDLARSRTAHFGLSSLDVNTAELEGPENAFRTLNSDYEAAKKGAGIPTVGDRGQPKVLSMGRGKGIGGFLSSPIYAARFKLDALANELLDPLSDLLGKKDYLFGGNGPSSLDCLAFGYLALLFYPSVPQRWLKEAIQARYPRIQRYISRMRDELLGSEEVSVADIWAISKGDKAQGQLHLPWSPPHARPLYVAFSTATWEIFGNLPIISTFTKRGAAIQAPRSSRKIPSSLPSPLLVNTTLAFSTTAIVALAGLAIHHRRNPREGDVLFWALRQQAGNFGEAGNILSALALPGAPFY